MAKTSSKSGIVGFTPNLAPHYALNGSLLRDATVDQLQQIVDELSTLRWIPNAMLTRIDAAVQRHMRRSSEDSTLDMDKLYDLEDLVMSLRRNQVQRD